MSTGNPQLNIDNESPQKQGLSAAHGIPSFSRGVTGGVLANKIIKEKMTMFCLKKGNTTNSMAGEGEAHQLGSLALVVISQAAFFLVASVTLLFIITSSGCEITKGENVTSNSGTEASGSASVLAKLSGYTMPSEISAVPAAGDGDTPAEAGSVVSLPVVSEVKYSEGHEIE